MTAGGPGKKPVAPILPTDDSSLIVPGLTRGQRILRLLGDMSNALGLSRVFRTPPVTVDVVNEQLELGRFDRSIKRVTMMSALVAAFGCFLAVGAPFFAPIYKYHSITPEGKTALLVPLDLPNLTNPAVVSWSATAVTEILSFGFGDVEAKTVLQKRRFTPEGWKAFVKAFLTNKVSDSFKKNQMVMTTVPSDTPVIISQGVNEEDVFQWKLEVPIITTYAANNNHIKPESGIIQMIVKRVPYEVNDTGIAIDGWKTVKH